jgi:hypothetical protein
MLRSGMKNETKNLALDAEYPQATQWVPEAHAESSHACCTPYPYDSLRRICRRLALAAPSVES